MTSQENAAAREEEDGGEEAAAGDLSLGALPRRRRDVRRAAAAAGVGGGRGREEAAVGRVRLLRAGAAVAGHRLPPDQPLLQLQWLLPLTSAQILHDPWAVAAVQLWGMAILLQANHIRRQQDLEVEDDTRGVLAVLVLRLFLNLLWWEKAILGA